MERSVRTITWTPRIDAPTNSGFWTRTPAGTLSLQTDILEQYTYGQPNQWPLNAPSPHGWPPKTCAVAVPTQPYRLPKMVVLNQVQLFLIAYLSTRHPVISRASSAWSDRLHVLAVFIRTGILFSAAPANSRQVSVLGCKQRVLISTNERSIFHYAKYTWSKSICMNVRFTTACLMQGHGSWIVMRQIEGTSDLYCI